MLAALYLEDLPLVAHERAEPTLRDAPFAVTAGEVGSGAPLACVSGRASAQAVRRGMTVAQGRARCPELITLAPVAALEASTLAALRDLGSSLSPRLQTWSAGTDGWVVLDVAGLDELVGAPDQVARVAQRRGTELGLRLRVGVARTRTLACLAARGGDGCQVLAAHPELEKTFLGGLPVALLEPQPELALALSRFGVRLVRDLWRLPPAALATRFGRAAGELYRRALGEDAQGLVPDVEPLEFRESTQLDWPCDNLEPLLFVLRGLLDRLVARLVLRGFVAGDLSLTLGLEDGTCLERLVRIAAPAREVRPLLDLCRLALEEAPPPQPVTTLALSAAPEGVRRRQLDLFRPAGPSPQQLQVTLARLYALCGPERVGTPASRDTYSPDAFDMRSFAPALAGEARDVHKRRQRKKQEAEAAQAVLPLAVSNADKESAAWRTVPSVALRRFRPPREAEVLCQGERPVRLVAGEASGRIVAIAGPFRRAEDPWWEREPGCAAAHDIYDFTLESGRSVRAVCDARRDRWWVEGWYD